jgi:electron transfer flavoprotein beta subunit
VTNVLVCIKRVPDAAGDVQLTADEQAVDARYVGFTVSAHEECAVELAVRIAATGDDTGDGGTATVLSVGPQEAVEQLRSALGVGCSAAVLVEAEPTAYGPADVAREIAAVVTAHEAEGRTYDLVLLGNDAADTGDFQVGIRLAYLLGRPVVNGVRTVEVADGVATAKVAGPDGVETFAVPLPAVVTVLEGGVEPRYPTITGRMKAKKAKIETLTPSGEPRGSGRVRLTLPPAQPSEVEVLGAGPDAAPAVVDLLQRLGVMR